jgi:hypothetical protein
MCHVQEVHAESGTHVHWLSAMKITGKGLSIRREWFFEMINAAGAIGAKHLEDSNHQMTVVSGLLVFGPPPIPSSRIHPHEARR